MRHGLFAALFVFLVAYQANGAKITNKKLDEKLDQIINYYSLLLIQELLTQRNYPPFRKTVSCLTTGRIMK